MGTPTRIRGATPYGLALACELARRGVDVEVTDAREGPRGGAIVWTPRGQEHLHQLGLKVSGHRIHALTLVARGVRVAQVAMDELATPSPYLCAAPEGASLLLGLAERLQIPVRWEHGHPPEVGPRQGWRVEAEVGGLPDDEVVVAVDAEAALVVVPLGEGRARLHIDHTGGRPSEADWTRWMNERGPPGAWVREVGPAREVRSSPGPWDAAALWQDTEGARLRGWVLALAATGRLRASCAADLEGELARLDQRRAQGARFVRRVVTFRQPVGRDLMRRAAPYLAAWAPVQERVARLRGDLHLGFRDSPWVGEDRDPLLLARLTGDARAETPTVAGYLDFSAGPVPGDRAPDALFGPGGGRRLRTALRGHRHALLLFDGLADTDDGYRQLADIARRVEERFGDVVAACVVVPSERRPAALDWDGPMLQDPEFTLHTAYGARSECLVLIRPDGFVGYRAQPAQAEGLLRHLERLFVEPSTPDPLRSGT